MRSISFKHFLNNNIVTSNFKTWKYLISDVCNFPIKIWHNLFIFSFWDRVKKKIYPLTKWDLKSSYISHNFLNFDYQQIIKYLYWGKSIEIKVKTVEIPIRITGKIWKHGGPIYLKEKQKTKQNKISLQS